MGCNCGKGTPRRVSSTPARPGKSLSVGRQVCLKCGKPMFPRGNIWKCHFCKNEVLRK